MTFDESLVRRRLDSLAKPPGSLGKLEELAVRLCVVQETLAPQTHPRRAVQFAADHGVAASGVSAWPQDVTALVAQTIAAGRGVSSVLARACGCEVVVVDVGMTKPLPLETILPRRVRAGSRNLADEPALTLDEFEQALEVGREQARLAAQDGMKVVVGGEMGIGNTTPAACLAMLLAGVPLRSAVGRGAGCDDAMLAHKREIVAAAVERESHRFESEPRAAIAALSGLEIAALAGFYAESAALGLTILLDGFIATSAALIAEHLYPGSAGRMIAAHLSAEPGHGGMVAKLGLATMLDGWNLRLGEGSGALTFLPLVDAAAALVRDTATLEEVLAAARPEPSHESAERR